MTTKSTITLPLIALLLGAGTVQADGILLWSNDTPGSNAIFAETWSSIDLTGAGGGTENVIQNWGAHNRHTNDPLKDGLWGTVSGHIGPDNYGGGFRNYRNDERSVYTMQVDLRGVSSVDPLTLKFAYDSWIWNDGEDGFNVTASSIFSNGAQLLNPTSASNMKYELHSDVLEELTGIDSMGADNAFSGHATNSLMTGTAIFDLADFAGQITTLSFNFASNGSYAAEGINIDKIKIWGECATTALGGGSNAGCEPPGQTVPEPSTLALMMLGATAAYRRRRSNKS